MLLLLGHAYHLESTPEQGACDDDFAHLLVSADHESLPGPVPPPARLNEPL